jgi:two-component system, OmpR family, sensor kinase
MGRLFWKIFAGFWITLLLTVLVVATALTIRNEALRSAETELADGPRSDFSTRVTWSVFRHGGEAALRSLEADWNKHKGNMPLVVGANDQDMFGRKVPADALREARQRLTQDKDARGIRTLTTAAGQTYIIFQLNDPSHPQRDQHLLPPYRVETPILVALAAILASIVVSALLARHFSQPIGRLQNAFKAASAGKLDIRVAQAMGTRSDEIGELGREFDGMAQHLQQLVGSQNRLLHDVSHELRSPLARLQVAVGLARQNPAQIDTALTRIEREAERLDTLVGEVLTLSRLEARSANSDDDYVDIIELIASVVDDARFEAEGTGQRISFTNRLDEEFVMRARGKLLHRAIENIVRNALQHTPDQSTVEVTLQQDADLDRLLIAVADSGPGVPAEDLAYIFDPFFRSEGSTSTGYGLGLAIARRAIEAHGGRIEARNRAEGGLLVRITLPAVRAAEN